MVWKNKVKFRDILEDFNNGKDEKEEIQRIKLLLIERFSIYPPLKKFIPGLKKIKTVNGMNKQLDLVYGYCDLIGIWVEW
jgi:hypothetical protein